MRRFPLQKIYPLQEKWPIHIDPVIAKSNLSVRTVSNQAGCKRIQCVASRDATNLPIYGQHSCIEGQWILHRCRPPMSIHRQHRWNLNKTLRTTKQARDASHQSHHNRTRGTRDRLLYFRFSLRSSRGRTWPCRQNSHNRGNKG